jgi:SAM-dependent MidA family methyltransferase
MTAEEAMHESAHAERMLACIRERLAAAGGWLPFDAYMQLALYEPGLGYYSAGAHKLGAGGDFTTAPEISPLFGRCLARQCGEVLAALGGGDVVELGAGSGRLAYDVLATMAQAGVPPARYRILEVSADLRERQRALLDTLPPDLAARVEWLDAPPAGGWEGVLLANEVLDALPVECFAWRDGAPFERGVALDDAGQLAWRERAASPALAAEIERVRADAGVHWPSGYHSELCRRVEPWFAEVAGGLARGVALFIDYGLPRRDYYHPRRTAGTLRSYHRHRAYDDPFARPGLSDLTAWVDFTRVAEAAAGASFDVLGFVTQAALLLGLGIEAEVAAASDEATRIRRASEARQLLMPEEMGENFKAIALGREWELPLAGFAHQDLRRYL